MLRVALLLSALVCMGRGHHHVNHSAVQDTEEESDKVALVTAGNKDFAIRLYKKLSAHPESQGKNVFFSPSSVSVALAALSAGAREETHRQIFEGLGYNLTAVTPEDLHQYFRTVLGKAKTSDATSEGTAVFVDSLFKPHHEFLETLKQSYFADGFTVDFTKTEESANTINNYVKDKTNGKIDKLVEKLDPRTVMYLISYIHFKGKWVNSFVPELTRDDAFIVDADTKVPVQMMNREGYFDSYYDIGIRTTVLRLPFNSSYTMLLLLPDDMAELEGAISPAHVAKWRKWTTSRRYDVYLPKFSIKTSYSLKDVLADMGMTDMFGDRADLSGISAGKLAVSEVVHQATLDVDEAGAEAAAATGIGIMLMSFQPPSVLKFNRQFMVLITEDVTANILFMGKIVNPKI
ncbi:alpha-1-antitrypsin-like protein CM55-MS isoform 1-T2 [Synchiropus picturatus]